MEIICTRPGCSHPANFFGELQELAQVKTAQQRYCTTCGMPLILADRYLPEKLLGQGGFGAAYKARDRYSPKFRYCVVKQFKPSGNLSPQELNLAQDLFIREGEVLEELGNQHPQIPDLYAFFTPIVATPDGGQEQYFYLVQEFIDGIDLETQLQQQGQFNEVEIREILEEILQILDFIHQGKVIHRDIKPSNIMRDKSGKIYLLDFGAVKQIAHGSANGKSTGIYSMGFAPPEQMAGNQVYPATDLYALGVTCITLLTGKPAEQLYDHYQSRWIWHNYVTISDPLQKILQKMLQASPAQRFQSASEVIALLNAKPVSQPTTTIPNPSSVPLVQPTTPQSNQQQSQPKIAVAPSSKPLAPRKSPQFTFSLLEILGSAAFTGFEGGLLAVALTNVFAVSGVSIGILGAVIGGLVYGQTRRIIEKIDFIIIAAISTALVFFIPVLQGEMVFGTIVLVAAMSGVAAMAVTSLFRLVYLLLKKLL